MEANENGELFFVTVLPQDEAEVVDRLTAKKEYGL
jgi:hypothetical protein